MTVVLMILLFLGSCFIPLSSTQTTDRPKKYETITGQILFSPMDSTTTYLIDYTGSVNHTWSSNYLPGEAVYWLGNGTILRTIKTEIAGYGGSGGGIQKMLWDGTITWDYRYNTNGVLSHHDIKTLPNGNVIMIAWETKTRTETIDAGRNPDTFLGDTFLPSHIIEVKQTGLTSGEIVWAWHAWDHLIQDYDSSAENYGVVGDHPELIDINYGAGQVKGDWLHSNSIDYNEKFDQIMISVRNFNEIWVIDHSTTTEEAARHAGGNNGKGGDILYRWGNPDAYRVGTSNLQKFFGQHDASWIKPGCPGEGNILVFNNGLNRPNEEYSSVDEIVIPVNDNGIYYLEPGSQYGPESQIWRYMGNPPSTFYARGISGAQRLKDGDTLICNGVEGRFFEVTPDGTTVWEYVNPYPAPGLNNVFKIVYIPPEEPPAENPNLECSGSLSWTDIRPGATVNGTFQIQNIGDNHSLLNWSINTSSITWGAWSYTPDSGEGLTPEDGQISVQVSVVVPTEKNSEFSGYIRIENQNDPSDFDIIPVNVKTPLVSPPNPVRWTLIQQFLHLLRQWYSFVEDFCNSFHH